MSPRRRSTRIILISLLAVAVLVLGGAIAVLLPILTHQSAGGSGQRVPDSAVERVEATGADDRVRSLEAVDESGKPVDLGAIEPGQRITVLGSGFNSGIGIYLAICGIPADPEEKPGPCLGGIPQGATEGTVDKSALSSAWITNDWAWRAFATHRYGDEGSFEVTLTVPDPTVDGFDCRTSRCAISTRADHTATKDRVQDMLLPVWYAKSA